MSSAELHSLMSQLQEGDEYQSEYETNFGKPIRDPNTGFWTDTDKPGQRIAPPLGRGPHVPKFDPALGLKDANGVLIPPFVQTLDANYCLDKTKYKDINVVWNILQWEMASSGQKIRELREELRQQKNAVKTVKTNHEKHPDKHPGLPGVDMHTIQSLKVIYDALHRNHVGKKNKVTDKPKKVLNANQQGKRDLWLAKLNAARDARKIAAGKTPYVPP